MPHLKNKNILITGGAGFFGSHLCEELLKTNAHQITILDDLSNGDLSNIENIDNKSSLTFIKGSILDRSLMASIMKNINVVFHLATLGVRHSLGNPIENHRVNAEGTLYLLEAAKQSAIDLFVYCSSSEVYGTATNVPMPETHLTNPHTIYGASKLVGEHYTKAYHDTYKMNTLVLRPFNLYGERSHFKGNAGEFIPKAILRALHHEPILIFGEGSQTRDFNYVKDTAQAFIKITNNASAFKGEVYNIGANFELSIQSIAKMILDLIPESKSKIKYLDNRPGDVRRLFSDSSKFKNKTGWSPSTEFKDGLQKTIDYFKELTLKQENLMRLEKGVNYTVETH